MCCRGFKEVLKDRVDSESVLVREFESEKLADLNGTYLTFFGCPFFLASALAERRVFVEKGIDLFFRAADSSVGEVKGGRLTYGVTLESHPAGYV